jgi:protease-4|tara:strand:+ start:99090 stop:99923 length:834 start_codon:yes stop_codon:yes gene_type:complete
MKLKYFIIGSVLLLFFIGTFSGFISSDRIAVLEINGVIDNPKTYLKSLDEISKDEKIKGLIVRIDSPGGTVGSSQEVYSSLKDISIKIPVVASIIDVGASGGYLIACGADNIYANAGSITGSIGVISQYYDASKLLEFLKFNIEILKSGEYKDSGSPTRPLNENERKILNNLLIDIHEQFKEIVKKERGLTDVEVDNVSQGQVFTGLEAKRLKLVDEIGGLSSAKKFILNKIGVQDMKLDVYPKKKKKLLDNIIPESIGINNFESIFFKKILYLYTP